MILNNKTVIMEILMPNVDENAKQKMTLLHKLQNLKRSSTAYISNSEPGRKEVSFDGNFHGFVLFPTSQFISVIQMVRIQIKFAVFNGEPIRNSRRCAETEETSGGGERR